MNNNYYNPFGQGLFGQPMATPKAKVFVSYHHLRDQAYYDRFRQLFSEGYDVITDTSIDRVIDSDSSDYQQQVIRDNHITGSSVTVVLCGSETWKRRWIDWEILMTLNKKHALLGIALPTAVKDPYGRVFVPDRLYANITSGFANWIMWTEDPLVLKTAIDAAKNMARNTTMIQNREPRMQRSRS